MPTDNIRYVQNNHMRPDEIDVRNAARLMTILDKWETGKYQNIWYLLYDVYEAIELANPLFWQGHEKDHPDRVSDFARKNIDDERSTLAPYIKPSFLGDLNSDDILLSLKGFKKTLESSEGNLTSFDIAALIFSSVSIDDKQRHPFQRDIASLKIKAAELQTPHEEIDLFHFEGPEPEAAFRKRLEPYIATLRAWCQEQGITGKIIGNITADGSGSAPFRPHVFNYNFLRDCPEKENLFAKEIENPSDDPEDQFFNFEDRRFDPQHSFHKEYIYPYPVVYVTTYAVTFFPQTSADAEKLKQLLQKSLERLKDTEQRFGNPVEYSSSLAYKRPSPLRMTEKEGHFQVDGRVDLDDLYNLYYLLEDYIVPSFSIAQTLNAAGLVEARSPIKPYDDLGRGTSYSVENSSKINQMGMVQDHQSAPLEHALEDIFRLYALGKLDEKGVVQQSMNMADMVLAGHITNQSKTLLPYEGMSQAAKSQGHQLMTYDAALIELTKVFMKAMAGFMPDAPVESIGNMIFQAAARGRDAMIADLQAHDLCDIDAVFMKRAQAIRDEKIEDLPSKIAKFQQEEQIALTISDALSGYNPRFYDRNEDKRAQAIIPSSPYRLVLRDPKIEPCIARNFAGTPYTSRMSGDPFPRIALPARLAKFLRPEDKPAAEQALLSFSFK